MYQGAHERFNLASRGKEGLQFANLLYLRGCILGSDRVTTQESLAVEGSGLQDWSFLSHMTCNNTS